MKASPPAPSGWVATSRRSRRARSRSRRAQSAVAPHPAQQEEPEQGAADQRAPPAGRRQPRPRPVRRRRSRTEGAVVQEQVDPGESDRVGRDHAGQLRDPPVAPPQSPHDRFCSRRLRIGSDQGRAHEATQVGPEPLLDQALHQHEHPDGDEEARPGAEIEQERPRRGGTGRDPEKSAQHEGARPRRCRSGAPRAAPRSAPVRAAGRAAAAGRRTVRRARSETCRARVTGRPAGLLLPRACGS